VPVSTTRPLQPKPDTKALEKLMERYQRADAEAGTVLVESLSTQIFQFFMAHVRNRGDAEDLLQDFWLRIHNARHTYRCGEPLLPWMYAIAHRVRIDHYRRTRRINEHELVDQELVNFSAQPGPSKKTPSLHDLLKKLPETQREVLVLMKVSGLTLEEVARATGSSVGAVKQKAHRGYEKLRKLFGEER
jgi:RNA polymerase sigma-70 factor, ECF subfamily